MFGLWRGEGRQKMCIEFESTSFGGIWWIFSVFVFGIRIPSCFVNV